MRIPRAIFLGDVPTGVLIAIVVFTCLGQAGCVSASRYKADVSNAYMKGIETSQKVDAIATVILIHQAKTAWLERYCADMIREEARVRFLMGAGEASIPKDCLGLKKK